MSFYETYILPKFLDCVCSQEGFQNKRAQIFPHASGEVLEIGVGTGLNFEFYDFDKVTSVKGIDPANSSLEIAKKISLGKMNKFKEENALLTQAWVMEPKKKVKDILKELNLDKIKINEFSRIKIGE